MRRGVERHQYHDRALPICGMTLEEVSELQPMVPNDSLAYTYGK